MTKVEVEKCIFCYLFIYLLFLSSIQGIDYTKSNLHTGRHTFGGQSLHAISPGRLNPYQEVSTMLPPKVKTHYVHFRSHTEYFLLSWIIPVEISRRSMLFHKGSIYHIEHIYIQPFSMEVDWPEMVCLMEVSTKFYICTYCVFTLWGTIM